jgi:hypothetical protein
MNARRRTMTMAAMTPPDGPEDLLAAPARAVCVAPVLSACALSDSSEVEICDALDLDASTPVSMSGGGDDDSTVTGTDEVATSWARDDDTRSTTLVTVITGGETRSTAVGVGVAGTLIITTVVAELSAVRTVVTLCCSSSHLYDRETVLPAPGEETIALY